MHHLMIVKAGRRAAGRTQALLEDRLGGGETFSVPLSATGVDPPTHYMSGWGVDAGAKIRFRNRFKGLEQAGDAEIIPYDIGISPDTPAQELRRLGLVPITEAPP